MPSETRHVNPRTKKTENTDKTIIRTSSENPVWQGNFKNGDIIGVMNRLNNFSPYYCCKKKEEQWKKQQWEEVKKGLRKTDDLDDWTCQEHFGTVLPTEKNDENFKCTDHLYLPQKIQTGGSKQNENKAKDDKKKTKEMYDKMKTVVKKTWKAHKKAVKDLDNAKKDLDRVNKVNNK